jgi:hypothetical protein
MDWHHFQLTIETLIPAILGLALFVWFLNWRPKSIGEKWRKQRQVLRDPLDDHPPGKTGGPDPNPPPESE